MTSHIMIAICVTKGILMMLVITSLANAGFLQSLAIAICSATITGIFLVISTVAGSRHTSQKVDELTNKIETQAEDAGHSS